MAPNDFGKTRTILNELWTINKDKGKKTQTKKWKDWEKKIEGQKDWKQKTERQKDRKTERGRETENQNWK